MHLLTVLPGWKCAFEIVDHSVRERNAGLQLNIFCSKAKMPSTPSFADVIIVSQAKVSSLVYNP